MDKEIIAVNTIYQLISKNDYLVADIPSKDKGVSWDGFIYVYDHPGDNHPKDDLKGRVPIQVKGHEVNDDDLLKEKISYPIEVAHLRNYLYDGGAVLFVVCFNHEGEHARIYYKALLPFDLKDLLKGCSNLNSKRPQKSIQLQVFPDDKKNVTTKFLNFVFNKRRQSAYIESSFEGWDSINNEPKFDTLTFGYMSIGGKGERPFEYMFNNDFYLYADIGYNILIPVEHVERLDMAVTERPCPITISGKQYYHSIKICFYKDHEEIQFGNSSTVIIDKTQKKITYKFRVSGNLSQRITDEGFICDAINSGGFRINGVSVKLNRSEFPVKERKMRQNIQWLKMVKKSLELAHAQRELDCDSLTKNDERNIHLLVTALIDKKPVRLGIKESSFGTLKISNLSLLMVGLKRADNGLFDLFSYYDNPVICRIHDDNKKEYESTYFAELDAVSIEKYSNIDLPVIINKITQIPISQVYINQVTLFLLELLKAYDSSENKRKDILTAAENLQAWILRNDQYSPKEVLTLNSMQIKKRKGHLSPEDIHDLNQIANNKEQFPDILAGAYLLIDDHKSAKENFDKLDDVGKERFLDYPILHFWNSTNDDMNVA